MKLGREVSRHNELDNWRNTHRFESVMATKWLLLTISETEPGLWDRLSYPYFNSRATAHSDADSYSEPCASCGAKAYYDTLWPRGCTLADVPPRPCF